MIASPAQGLRARLAHGICPFVGIYDVFSATLAARHYEALFVSGFGVAASHYGLPDIGFIAWPDLLALVQRIRSVLPGTHLLVDVDDGFGDPEVASHVVARLEAAGASGVVLEDQRRPRRCGHLDGKQLLELPEYLVKLERVLAARRDLVVVARTDATDVDEILTRARAFADAGADAILADGIRSLDVLGELARAGARPFVFNQIAGGKSPPASLTELAACGVSMVIYSTPCLFAAQTAIEDALVALRERDGRLPDGSRVGVASCTALLTENLRRRDGA